MYFYSKERLFLYAYMRRFIYAYMLEQKLIFEHEQAVRIQSSIPPCESKSRIPPYILYRRTRTHAHTHTRTHEQSQSILI